MRLLAVSYFIFYICSGTVFSQPLPFQLELTKGKTYGYTLQSEVDISQIVNGDETQTSVAVQSKVTFLVRNEKKGEYLCEARYKALSIELGLPETTISIHSDHASPDDVFSTILSKLTEKPFQLSLSREGEITEVKGMDALFDDAFKDFQKLPEEKVAQVKGQLIKAFGEASFVGNFHQFGRVFPTKAVSKGDEWTTTSAFNSGMKAEIINTYTLQERQKKKVQLSALGDIATTDKENYYELNGRHFKYDLNGLTDSELAISTQTGWIIEGTINQTIEGDSFLQPNDLLPDGLLIPISIKNKMTVSGALLK